MTAEPVTFRTFFDALHAAHMGPGRWRPLTIDVLLAWAERLQPHMAQLQRLAPAGARHLRGRAVVDDRIALYALSRVSDLLSLPFQPLAPDSARGSDVLRVSAPELQAFWEALGLSLLIPTRFHPFACEIAAVLQAPDTTEPVELLEVRWPGLMLGELLIARAGVAVWGGIEHVRADIAPCSLLYEAFRRRYRPTVDLSYGWGSNSQWGTAVRRDYAGADGLYYNVDGTFDAALPTPKEAYPRGGNRDELTPAQRLELVRNRCFVVTDRSGEHWPYDDYVVEPRTSSDW